MNAEGYPRLRALAGLLLLGAAGCNSQTIVSLPQLDLVIGNGDGQFGVVGSQLPNPLRVVAQVEATGMPRKDVAILWDVTQGGAALVGASPTVTDSTGSAEIRVRLGSSPGEVIVRARIADQPNEQVAFHLFAVTQPTLSNASPNLGAAGDTIVLTGTNFSPVPDQNVVLFSGIRGRVIAATSTSLRVVVPRCLPARDVGIYTQLGVVASADTLPFRVTGGTLVEPLQVGQIIDVADYGGFECHALSGGGGAEYLAVVFSASTVGAARHAYALTALSSLGPAAIAEPAQQVVGRTDERTPGADEQARWDQHVRTLEAGFLGERARSGGGTRAPSLAAPAAAPLVGERRTFNVLNSQGSFEQVGAVARWIGDQAAIFVDTLAPAGGFTDGELAVLASRFDQVIYPQVTSTFGSASDLDANQRVIILFTPAVNRLTPRGSASFIGGFFYGIDLYPTSVGSNGGEVFYAVVPDPTGIHSSALSKLKVSAAVPAVLAHEFQHMVHFNERILVRKAVSQDALWLSEGLAQMAEEIVARAYEWLGDSASDSLFRSGVRSRSRQYLARTDTVSVIVTTGQGSLPERGAGFLNLLYLEDRVGGDLLKRLTRTTRTGVANVEAEAGLLWRNVIGDWWAASYLDGLASGQGALAYPAVDLRGFLGLPFPLQPSIINTAGLDVAGAIWSSSASYYLVRPDLGGTMTLRLGGEAGGASAPQSALTMRIIRIS